jgi:NAD(P)-dependent dehydrogenase (short-subunit alcohol dehydrogenase family)
MSAEEVDAEAWLETFRVNAVAPLALAGAFRRHVAKSPMRKMAAVTSRLGSIASTDGGRYVYRSSKAALNMVTAQYAKELWDTPIKVNAANPGYCATDLNGHRGFRDPVLGAEVSVHLATLPDDGPTGVLWGDQTFSHGASADGVLPW